SLKLATAPAATLLPIADLSLCSVCCRLPWQLPELRRVPGDVVEVLIGPFLPEISRFGQVDREGVAIGTRTGNPKGSDAASRNLILSPTARLSSGLTGTTARPRRPCLIASISLFSRGNSLRRTGSRSETLASTRLDVPSPGSPLGLRSTSSKPLHSLA